MIKELALSPRRIALFLWHWLLGGFFLGTLTLTGPVRWATGYARSSGWSEPAEKAVVFALIAALAVISALLARLLTLKTETAASRAGRYGLPAVSLALFLAALAAWMNPKLMTDSGLKNTRSNVSGLEFVFGNYPEIEKLRELKREGYTAIISLLSPAVVPFEPVLISREAGLAKEAGIEVIHIPMLPWVSANAHVEARLSEILKRGAGKYYVHCYLGKDRVNVFKRMLEATAKDAKVKSLEPGNLRTLSDIRRFERGAISVLAPGVFFIPYPTDEEFFGYILNGSVKTLVSLLDPRNKENLPWLEKEKKIATQYRVKLMHYPWKALDQAKKKAALKELDGLEKPMAIHAFNSTAPECLEFMEAYRKAR